MKKRAYDPIYSNGAPSSLWRRTCSVSTKSPTPETTLERESTAQSLGFNFKPIGSERSIGILHVVELSLSGCLGKFEQVRKEPGFRLDQSDNWRKGTPEYWCCAGTRRTPLWWFVGSHPWRMNADLSLKKMRRPYDQLTLFSYA